MTSDIFKKYYKNRPNSPWKGYSSILLFVLLINALYKYTTVTHRFKHWTRMRHVVENVDFFSEKLPLQKDGSVSFEFERFMNKLKNFEKPPFIIFMDMTNIDVAFNFICNLDYFDEGRERLVAVSFDRKAEKEMNRIHPSIPTVTVDFQEVLSSLPSDMENRGYLIYQLILLLRSRISGTLARNNINFWAMQQDSIWIDNVATMDIEDKFKNSLMIFDTVGNDEVVEYERMKGWICGSTFFVRANSITADFFDKVEIYMRSRLSPDSAIMTYLCGNTAYQCGKMPRNVASSSDYFLGTRSRYIPAMIQIDYKSKFSKMELLRKNYFEFAQNGTCNHSAVQNLKYTVPIALPEARKKLKGRPPLHEEIYYFFKERFGRDPFNNKRFLHVHDGLV